MPVYAKAGTFFRPASAATPTVISGLGFKPNGILFLPSDATASAVVGNSVSRGVFATALGSMRSEAQTVRTYGEFLTAVDNIAPDNIALTRSVFIGSGMDRGFWQNRLDPGAVSIEYSIGDISLNADGFSILWRTDGYYDGQQEMVSYLAFGGDADARIIYPNNINFLKGKASQLAIGYRFTATFDPLFWPTGALVFADLDWWGVDALTGIQGSSLGAASSGASGAQWARGMAATWDRKPVVSRTRVSNTNCITLMNDTGAVVFAAKIVLWQRGSITFEVTAVDTNAETMNVGYGVMVMGGAPFDVGMVAKPTGAAPSSQTIVTSARPRGVLLSTTLATAVDTTINDARTAEGVSDGANHATQAAAVRTGLNTTDVSSVHRNDRALVSPAGTPVSSPDMATATLTQRDRFSLTWTPNTANAYRVGWAAFCEGAALSGSVMAGQSAFYGTRFGTPVMLSATMAALSTLYPQTFGTVGNLPAVAMATVSAFAPRLGMHHFLSSAMVSLSQFAPLGIRFNRNLAATMATISTFLPIKPGSPAPLSGVLFAADSVFSARGITYTRPLSAAMSARSLFDSRFRIIIPAVREAGPDDLPGTVNWHPNPSAERGLIGWFDEGGGTAIAQSTEQAWDGAFSVRKATTALGQGVSARSFAGLELTGLDANGSPRRVNGQLRVWASAETDVEVWTRARYTDGTTVDGERATFTHPGGAWVPPYFAPALELDPARTLNYVEVVAVNATGAAVVLYVDGAQLEEDRGYGPTHFAIGSYGHETGTWDGVPHVSMTKREPIPMIIRGVGRGGEVVVEATMYRATWDNQWLEDISDMVIDASVSMDTTREVTWAIDANFTYEGYARLEENFDWIAPVLTVTYPDGTVKRGQLGLYFLVPGSMSRGEYERSVRVSAFDPLWLLARQAFTGPVRAFAGADRIRAVRDILDGAVLTGGDPDTSGRRYSGPNSNTSWKRKREWPRKTDRLELVNEILESSAMSPLYTVADGEIQWRRRGEDRLKDRRPVRAWAANLPPGHRVDATIPRISTLHSEVVGTIKTTPEALDAYDEILLINDDPSTRRIRVRGRVRGHGKHKRVIRGRGDRRRVRSLYAPLVDDEATAAEIAAALADELSNRTEGVEMSVLPDPSVNYCHETVLLAVWDAYGDPVAVGQFAPTHVTWGFTPSTCLQKMTLHRIDNGDAEILVTVE